MTFGDCRKSHIICTRQRCSSSPETGNGAPHGHGTSGSWLCRDGFRSTIMAGPCERVGMPFAKRTSTISHHPRTLASRGAWPPPDWREQSMCGSKDGRGRLRMGGAFHSGRVCLPRTFSGRSKGCVRRLLPICMGGAGGADWDCPVHGVFSERELAFMHLEPPWGHRSRPQALALGPGLESLPRARPGGLLPRDDDRGNLGIALGQQPRPLIGPGVAAVAAGTGCRHSFGIHVVCSALSWAARCSAAAGNGRACRVAEAARSSTPRARSTATAATGCAASSADPALAQQQLSSGA